jgi:diphthamide biosynthesis protein 7
MMACFDTVYPADSVEFCPHPSSYNIFVCGTYNLEKSRAVHSSKSAVLDSDVTMDNPLSVEKQRRRGTCLLFEVTPNNPLEGSRELYASYLPFRNSLVSIFL